MKRLPGPEEVLARLFQQVELDKINQEVDEMSDEQIEKELAAEGYDAARIDAAFAPQQAMLDELLADERRQTRQKVTSYAAGVVTGAAVAMIVRPAPRPITQPESTEVQHEERPRISAPRPTAAESRALAFQACDRGDWAECAEQLDLAKELDPAGENDPAVQKARRLIAHH
jgi:hypothetical protein